MFGRRSVLVVLSAVTAVSAACASAAAVPAAREFKFDMGTPTSRVWPECVRVTKDTTYDKKRGYGWKPLGRIQHVQRMPWHQRSGKVAIPDDLWGDFVSTYRKANAFQLDLPDGSYEVVLLIGDVGCAYSGGSKVRSLYPSDSIIVKANGATVIEEIIDETNILDYWFQNEHTEYRRGDDPWRKYIDTKLYPRAFPVTVTSGRLLLTFSPDCRIAALFVHPLNRSAEFNKWYRAQSVKRRQDFLKRYDALKHMPLYPRLRWTDEETARGYRVFSRSYLEDVHPNSVPAADELRVAFNIFAARGEREPVTFSVTPSRELKGVRIICSDLAGPRGSKIPADCWDVRHIRYLQVPNHSVHDRENIYRIEGRLMDKRASKDLEDGTTRRIWATLTIPESAAPGVYKGTITLQPANAASFEMPVTVRVFPFTLRQPADVAIGIFYSPASPWRYFKGKEDLYDEDVRSSLELLRKHGFTSVAYSIDRPRVWIDKQDGKIKADLSMFDRFFKIFREVGMSMTAPYFLYGNDGGSGNIRVQPTYRMGWIESNGAHADAYLVPEWVKRFRELLRYQVDYGKQHGWPPIVFCVHDEVGGRPQKELDGLAKIMQATYVQEPEVKTGGCLNGPRATCLVPYHDYPMYNNGVPFNEETLALIRKHKKTMTIDNFGQARWSIGFWMWRIDPKLAADGFFCWIGADPYNPFDDATASELAIAYPGRSGWVPTPKLARMGEGIDDYKYAYTLRQTVRAAEKKGVSKDLITRAKETLRFLWDFVDVRLTRYGLDGRPSQEAIDALRFRIARDIAALHGVNIPAPEKRKPDTRWWNAAWRRRLPLKIDVGLYTRRDVFVVVETDLDAVCAPTGAKGLVENSMRLVEANTRQPLVPFDLTKNVTVEGKDRLMWRVSGRTPALTSRWFYLYFDGPGAKARPRELVLNAKNVPGINLVGNPGFESGKPGEHAAPGWVIPAPKQLTQGHSVTLTSEDKKSGRLSLKILKSKAKLDMKKHYTDAYHDPIPILPGRRYRLSGWIKRAEGQTHNEIMVWWLGQKRQYLGNRKFDAYSRGLQDWKRVVSTGDAPQFAYYARIRLFVTGYGTPSTAYFDDIRFELLPPAGHPLPQVTVGKPEKRN